MMLERILLIIIACMYPRVCLRFCRCYQELIIWLLIIDNMSTKLKPSIFKIRIQLCYLSSCLNVFTLQVEMSDVEMRVLQKTILRTVPKMHLKNKWYERSYLREIVSFPLKCGYVTTRSHRNSRSVWRKNIRVNIRVDFKEQFMSCLVKEEGDKKRETLH